MDLAEIKKMQAAREAEQRSFSRARLAGSKTQVHDFGNSRHRGEQAELFLDGLFSDTFMIIADRVFQSRGYDREFVPLEGGEPIRVEYKADFKAADTGRVFIETWSDWQKQVRGWALTSEGDLLLSFIPSLRRLYVVKFDDLRAVLSRWTKLYPEVSTRSADGERSWRTVGTAVPFDVIEALAVAKMITPRYRD